MDVLFQIIVPKITEIDELEITQPAYEWDGVDYPQGPQIASWRDVSLSFDEQTQYLKKFLPENYLGEDWIWLKVSDETLDKYEISVNDDDDDGKSLETLLRFLLTDINKWVIAFILQYDQIDSVYRLGVEECIGKLRNNLDRNITKEGFIAYR